MVGTAEQPLFVAIIGSGPSGFYAAEHLQASDLVVHIDMYDRLPTPFGLVRGGVAPDHQKIKSVTRIYDRIAEQSDFRFFGNVEFGRHIDRDEIAAHYHAVIYAVGARKARRLDIPGEDLPGSHPAPAFVGWYNGHPDYSRRVFDLSGERAVVIGNGNVAVDVARILASPPEALKTTDIADRALQALRRSSIRDVVMIGRRGPAQAAFTSKELREIGEIPGVQVVVDPAELVLDEITERFAADRPDRVRKNLEQLAVFAAQPGRRAERTITLRFLRSPTEILGPRVTTGVRLGRNTLTEGFGVAPTGAEEVVETGLVLRAIGYLGAAIPGVPFDERNAVIPNEGGRVITSGGKTMTGEYVVGWIKRGPVGIIGTNKPDALETVRALVEDVGAGRIMTPTSSGREAAEARLRHNRPEYTTYEDWQLLDQLEQDRGRAGGRSREKFTRISDMLDALAHAKEAAAQTPS